MPFSDLFLQDRSDVLRKWLESVDITEADVFAMERFIQKALLESEEPIVWEYMPKIGKLAEPVNLNNLVGDLLNGAYQEVRYLAGRIDRVYSYANAYSNILKLGVENLETTSTELLSKTKRVLTSISVNSVKSYWIGESFNNTVNVDLQKTIAFVDTDAGVLTLPPETLRAVTPIRVEVLGLKNKELPGVNMLPMSVDMKSPDSEPTVNLYGDQFGKNINAVIDSDPVSALVVERNYVRANQKVSQRGRAYVYDPAGEEKSVQDITKGFDWDVTVSWPDGLKYDTKLAEFVTSTNPSSVEPISLKIRVVFEESSNISFIRIIPEVEPGSEIRIQRVVAQTVSGDSLEIAREVRADARGLKTYNSVRTNDFLSSVGESTKGWFLPIPFSKDVTSVDINLESPAREVQYLAHPFKEVQKKIRTERRTFGIRSVKKRYVWNREPLDSQPKQLKSSESFGFINDVKSLGANAFSASAAASAASKAIGSVFTGGSGPAVAGKLASLGKFLGTVGNISILATAAAQIGKALFGTKKTIEVVDSRVGYDLFTGYRACIKIRDISGYTVTYKSFGEYYSTKLTFPTAVNTFGFFSEVQVPESWGGVENWVSFYISFDGENFTQVPSRLDALSPEAIKSDSPVRDVWVKIVLSGNSADPYHSPTVTNFAVQGVLL